MKSEYNQSVRLSPPHFGFAEVQILVLFYLQIEENGA
jgi:hypothetical protein